MAKEKTPAQKKAQAAYMEKFSRIALRVDPIFHERIKSAADAQGQSVNGYIVDAVSEKMERDGGKA